MWLLSNKTCTYHALTFGSIAAVTVQGAGVVGGNLIRLLFAIFDIVFQISANYFSAVAIQGPDAAAGKTLYIFYFGSFHIFFFKQALEFLMIFASFTLTCSYNYL